jgi:hypothetical protein
LLSSKKLTKLESELLKEVIAEERGKKWKI